MNKQPNILFLMTDQMRGDCMGFAGHPNVKTPYLDSIASTGQDCTPITTDASAIRTACALIFP